MKQHILAAILVAALASSVAHADSLDLTFTVSGNGGLSQAQTGVSDSQFWWADSSGTVPASTVAATGFVPFPAFEKFVDMLGFGAGGSLLTSSAFTLGADQMLDVNFSILTGNTNWISPDFRVSPHGFALLIQDNGSPIVLANTTATLGDFFTIETAGPPTSPHYVSPADGHFTPVSPGVTTTATPLMPLNTGPNADSLDLTFGDLHFWNDPLMAADCGCSLDVASSYTPGAGTFRLVFGIYNYWGGTAVPSQWSDGVIAVKGVDVSNVPEPSSLALLPLGLIGIVVAGRYRKRMASGKAA